MNELQTKEFEILRKIIEICDRLGLTYYMICGSALGAVKYSGFIPWDDDIDIGLPRKDYSIFVRECQKYLPDYYFLQNYRTEKGLAIISSKVRDRRTTYIENDHCHLKKMCHGVFVDIIPLDPYPDDANEFLRHFNKFNRCRRVHLKSNHVIKDAIKSLLKPFFSITKYYSEFEEYLMELTKKDCENYCNLHNSKNDKLYYPVDVYGNGKMADFHGLKVRVPEKIDEYLTGYYGDWRADLPLEQKKGHHYAKKIDLEHSYNEYMR